ncbi:hypothetical protein CRUP_012462 [Coryphaenoides rupestris]|nr:hypothetical protein CRUP_012462 [Coryphaenoides rupestris]
MYPGYMPGYPFSAPPWAPPPLPSVCPAVAPSSTATTSSSIPPLIPKEEMYQHKRRVKKRASSSRGAHRSRQSPQRPQHPPDGMGSDFTKELLEYRRSSSRPRHRRHSVRRHANRSHCHGYKRSRSPTSPSSSPSRRMRSSRSRSPRGSLRKDSSSRHRHHATRSRGHSGRQRQRRSSSVVAHYQQYASCDAESYRQWEREFMEWYDKYFASYTGKPHHLQPPPLPPKPRGVPPVSGSTHRPDLSSSSYYSKHDDSHPKPSPSPASNDEIGSLSYQQQCTVMCGQQASDREEPEMPGPTPEHSVAMPTTSRTSPVDLNDKRKKRRRDDRVGEEKGEAEESPSLDDHNHHLDSHESRSAKPWCDGEDPRQTQGTKQRKLPTTEGPVSGSLAKSSLWEGAAMKVKKPQSKTIKLNLNLGQSYEARKGDQSEQMAGRSTEEDKGDAGDEKVEATIETGVQEDVEDDGEMGETPVHTRRDGSERRHERKMPLKSLETHSSQGSSILVPEDKMVPMQGPRSRWDQLGEDEEVSGGNQEPTSTEVQSTGTAALGSDAVSVATKTAPARAGGTLEDRVRVPHQWETEGERERGRTWETARKAASPVCKEPSLALERRASPGDAEWAHKPSRAGRGSWRPRDRQGSGEQRAPQAVDKDRKREEPEGRAEEREQASEGADTQKRGASASRTSSSCTARDNKRLRDPADRRVARDPEDVRVARGPEDRKVVQDPEDRRVARDPEGRRVVRDPEDGRKRKREHERCSGGNSQTSSSSSSRSSSSSSFSQPDAYPQRTAATAGGISGVDGSSGRHSSSRYREYDAQPHYDRSAYEAHQEPQDRRGDADALKYHQQHRRYLNHDHHHPHVREHKDPLQPRGRPPALLASGHVRGDQGGQRTDPAHPGGAQAVADRGQDRPCRSDVFSRGWDAPLRPRKPIDIKIISGASLFQHANPEKKDRL